MPRTLLRFIWRVSARHQIWLVILSAAVLLVGIAPLEIQRRIVNDAFRGGDYRPILLLVGAYFGVAFLEGSVKLVLNIYRNWVGEAAVRWLRIAVFAAAGQIPASRQEPRAEGIQLAIVLDEADPIGGFVGASISEPVLQAGMLVSVSGYLLYLQPLMALVIAAVFLPQIGFVPMLQAAINRRIQTRVSLYRAMSTGIVNAGGARDRDGTQHAGIQAIFATNMAIYKLKFAMNFLMNLMTHGGVAAILALGGYFVVTGKTEIGTVVAFLSGLSKINDPWGDLVTWYRDLRATQVKYALVRDATNLDAGLGDRDGTLLRPGAAPP